MFTGDGPGTASICGNRRSRSTSARTRGAPIRAIGPPHAHDAPGRATLPPQTPSLRTCPHSSTRERMRPPRRRYGKYSPESVQSMSTMFGRWQLLRIVNSNRERGALGTLVYNGCLLLVESPSLPSKCGMNRCWKRHQVFMTSAQDGASVAGLVPSRCALCAPFQRSPQALKPARLVDRKGAKPAIQGSNSAIKRLFSVSYVRGI